MDSESWARVARQAVNGSGSTDAAADKASTCAGSAGDTDYSGLRILSIFVILIGGGLGAILPVFLARSSKTHVPKMFFFVAKYFGSGVILATAWMHLLSPASDNLRDECLDGILPDYDWAMVIGLMTVMLMFLLELVISHFDFGFGDAHDDLGTQSRNRSVVRTRTASNDPSLDILAGRRPKDVEAGGADGAIKNSAILTVRADSNESPDLSNDSSSPPEGDEHLAHQRDHKEGDSYFDFAAQMTAIFILEFGVIFHSIFIGLTLAITDGFIVLFIVLCFHQTFEGLGLGARLATATWPTDRRRWMPYILASGYAISTPIAIAIGLGVRSSLSLDGASFKVVNGVFDAISGGILMYTGLVELLAHEFMFNPQMREAGLKVQLQAWACVAVGVTLMAVLAKWA